MLLLAQAVRIRPVGVELEQDKLDKVYEDFLKLADKKKDITDDDILVLAGADRSVNTVSYTHLDVYKRQRRGSTVRIRYSPLHQKRKIRR